jgi:Uncharacterized protein conserved in bacteria
MRHVGLPATAEEIEAIARAALAALPRPFADSLGEIVLQVEEFADESTLDSLGIEDPFDLTGLYEGVPLTERSVDQSGTLPERIRLFRRPILDEWATRDETLALVLHSLRTFRESRDLQSEEARFLRLGSMAESLAKRHTRQERLSGPKLRKAIAEVACSNTLDDIDIQEATVRELWDQVRNPLTHTAQNFASIGHDAKQDIATMEKLTFNMIKGTVLNWRIDFTNEDSDASADETVTPAESTSHPDMPIDADEIPFK